MCGICGIVSAKILHQTRISVIESMCAAMVHRGPDDIGIRDFGAGGCCIGMRRLSIIDRSVQGRQPMANEDGTKWVVLNGEIYNFRLLRSELEAKGHSFRSRTDTEVIPHLYQEVGANGCERLRGMFGFAVWNARRRELVLARDRLGIKPLYYAAIPGGIVFASEIGALLASGLIERELDLGALDHYLALGYAVPPRTLAKGVLALPAGHRAFVRDGRVDVEQWWTFPEAGSVRIGPEEIIPQLRGLLEESIRLHRISDVPVGAFLSGGIDSTAVVGLMSNLLDEPVRTFSVGFQTAPMGFDERTYTAEAAQAFGPDHTEVVVGARDVLEELPRMVEHIDQPSADGVNTYLVSRAAKRGGLTVALSGLGGDEVFGGYGTFRAIPRWGGVAHLWGRLPCSVRRETASMLGYVAAFAGDRNRQKAGRLWWVDSSAGLYALARFALWPEEQASLYSAGVRAYLETAGDHDNAMGVLRSLIRPGDRPWRMVSLLEMQTYMGWRLLRDTDAMSMAHSLEVRVPFVDHEVVEFVCGLPPGWERRWGHPKRLLTSALRDPLPQRIVARKRQGFAFPMAQWIEQELRPVVDEALSPDSIRRRGLFSTAEIGRLRAGFRKGIYESSVLWKLVILELWMRARLDRQSTRVGSPIAISLPSRVLSIGTPTMISVIITAYNAEPFIASAVHSILQQTYTDLDCLVIDDGSTDRTVKVVEQIRDPRLRIIEAGRIGRGRALNLGLSESSSPYVAIQDADDLSHLRRLEIGLAALEGRPDYGAVGQGIMGEMLLIKELDVPVWSTISADKASFPVRDVSRSVVYCNPLGHSTLLLRREALETIGGYNEEMLIEDWDLLLRLVLAGYKLGWMVVPPLHAHRVHPGQFFERGNRRRYVHAAYHLQRKARKELGRSPLLELAFLAMYGYRLLPERIRHGWRQLLGHTANAHPRSYQGLPM
jgi:asparagine synthase (glutamine-hydrolysing)